MVHLKFFTLRGKAAGEVMSQLLQSSAVPVLPASLKMLEQKSPAMIGLDTVLRWAILKLFDVLGMRSASVEGSGGPMRNP